MRRQKAKVLHIEGDDGMATGTLVVSSEDAKVEGVAVRFIDSQPVTTHVEVVGVRIADVPDNPTDPTEILEQTGNSNILYERVYDIEPGEPPTYDTDGAVFSHLKMDVTLGNEGDVELIYTLRF